jgi:hypothetical protein
VTTVLGVVLVVAAVGLVLSSPRHRAFYFGAGGGLPAPPAGAPTAVGTPRPQPGPRATFGIPLAIRRDPPVSPMPAPSPVRHTHVRIPRLGADGTVQVPVTDTVPATLPARGLPSGWEVRRFVGQADAQLVRDDGRLVLRLASEGSSFALFRDVIVDLRRLPALAWSWKAVRLPAAGDGRAPATDDHVAQVYIVFPRWPNPRTNSDVLGYVWDTRAPAGQTLRNARAGNVRSIVVQSGYERLGVWVREERDVRRDYRELFGREPTRVGKIALMTDSNDTRGRTEALFGDLIFFRPPARNARMIRERATMPPG